MNTTKIKELVLLLEAKGLTNAVTLVLKYIVPETECAHISLYQAAKDLANCESDHDPARQHLQEVLRLIKDEEIIKFDKN